MEGISRATRRLPAAEGAPKVGRRGDSDPLARESVRKRAQICCKQDADMVKVEAPAQLQRLNQRGKRERRGERWTPA